MQDYSCPFCGSNLTYIEKKDVFSCGYCGHLYAGNMARIDLKMVEDLRQRKQQDVAKTYIELLLEKDPDDFLLNWEHVNTIIDPGPLSRYISTNSADPAKIKRLQDGGFFFPVLKKIAPDDMKQYISDLDELMSTWIETGALTNKYDSVKKEEVRIMQEKLPTIHGDHLYLALAAFAVVFAFTYTLSMRLAVGLGVIIFACAVYFYLREKKIHRYYMEDLNARKDAVRRKKIELEEQIDSCKAKAGELMNSAKKAESRLFNLISQ